jgi:hypothetical protein
MEQPPSERTPLELDPRLVSIMTTEHYNLQTGRSMTIAEASGRASLFVGAVSSGLVALALVGQLSRLGTAFLVFSLVVLPTLFLMGLLTFERVLQVGKADLTYARGINRIRHLYLEYAPQMQPYFILSVHDDGEETLHQEAMHASWFQGFLTMAGMIAIINSVLAGSFGGVLLVSFALPLWVCATGGSWSFSRVWCSTSAINMSNGYTWNKVSRFTFLLKQARRSRDRNSDGNGK